MSRVSFNDDSYSMNTQEAVGRFHQLLRTAELRMKSGEWQKFTVCVNVRPCDCESSLSGRDENCPLHGDSHDEALFGLPEWCVGECGDARCHRCFPRPSCEKHPKCVAEFDSDEEDREVNKPGCKCWGSNAIGHTDSDCPHHEG